MDKSSFVGYNNLKEEKMEINESQAESILSWLGWVENEGLVGYSDCKLGLEILDAFKLDEMLDEGLREQLLESVTGEEDHWVEMVKKNRNILSPEMKFICSHSCLHTSEVKGICQVCEMHWLSPIEEDSNLLELREFFKSEENLKKLKESA